MDYDDECSIHIGTSVAHPLLRKSLLGRTKVIATKGMKGNETFGRPSPKEQYGVAELLHHEEFRDLSKIRHERNFRRLNKEAVKMGVTTSRGMYAFRYDHDYRIETPKNTWVSHNPGLYDRSYTYGISSKPEGIMKTLIEGRYGSEWLERTAAKERARTRSVPMKRPYTVDIYARTTKRGGLGHSTKHPLEDAQEAFAEKDRKLATASFRMRQSIDVRPKVSTRWERPPRRLPRLRKDWTTGKMIEVDPKDDTVDVFGHLKYERSMKRDI
ncbi:putative protein of unknown function (DUF4483) [Monocercomonoides exilis]|uniref:putative protein of unknown function (DUF4483) n=1 Tax=Monocercomonoides exilis TaxID=2049356 RepID=UPI00355A9549|nr:putative protein of unknown function (DUF4483) [Monocercomonoides exilis]|eukprot:MONOS_10443.1-p1 / transcript=MONOS_10443.1 / gene=MONOS_10443 / organism=Monocercomonoides_exilis_PA203 / gene_product=unspecified product / transcript_product=unspecified product / location=Mono_scaffold00475:38377-39423(-) / protein_length=269 / sequence_SO=supercontig / SO=protein_coding / is_pseudo=false